MKNKYLSPEICVQYVYLENSITAASAKLNVNEEALLVEWQEEDQGHTFEW